MTTKSAGRRTKRTPEVEKRLLDAISAGNYQEAACAYAGVSVDSLSRWIAADADFAERVRQAEGQAEVAVVAHWRKHVPDNWQAARDFLARRHPERWGPKERNETTHKGDPNAPLQIDHTHKVDVDALIAAEAAYIAARRG